MARIARFVVPGLPHHVTQRGNRRERVFFADEDYELYRDLLSSQCRKQGVAVWAYCLMPNHIHLILVPDRAEALGRALGETHRRYSAVVNARLRVTGHLFQSRFGSAVMDEEHLMAAARYVALNPVRARLVARAEDWRWSSVKAHLEGQGRRAGQRRAAHGSQRRPVRRPSRPAGLRRGDVGAQGCGNDWPPARLADLPRPPRRHDRPRSPPPAQRAEAEGRAIGG